MNTALPSPMSGQRGSNIMLRGSTSRMNAPPIPQLSLLSKPASCTMYPPTSRSWDSLAYSLAYPARMWFSRMAPVSISAISPYSGLSAVIMA